MTRKIFADGDFGRVDSLDLSDCQLDDECLIRLVPVFGHVSELNLSDNNFTWLHIGKPKCHFIKRKNFISEEYIISTYINISNTVYIVISFHFSGFYFQSKCKKRIFFGRNVCFMLHCHPTPNNVIFVTIFLSVYIFTTIFFQHKKRCIMTLASL